MGPPPPRSSTGALAIGTLIASMLIIRCAGAGQNSTADSHALDRFRRLIPYMTYYVAQGLTHRGTASPTISNLGAVGVVPNTLEPFLPPQQNRARAPEYVVVSARRPHRPPPRTLFRYDYKQQTEIPVQNEAQHVHLKDQPFHPSPPLTPHNKDSDQYFKPVADPNYYGSQFVAFPDGDTRSRVKLRIHQQKPQLIQQVNNPQYLESSNSEKQQNFYKLLVLQQRAKDQGFKVQKVNQVQVQQLQQDQIQAQQVKEYHKQIQEQVLRTQQLQEAQNIKEFRQRIQAQQVKEAQIQLQIQQERELRAQQHIALQEQQARIKQLQIREQQLHQIKAQQEQIQRQEQEFRLRAIQQAILRQQKRKLKPTTPKTIPHQDDDKGLEVEQQVVVALGEVDMVLSTPQPPPSPPPAQHPPRYHVEVVASKPSQESYILNENAQSTPVVYADDLHNQVSVTTPSVPILASASGQAQEQSGSRELVAHLIQGLQLSNKLPQSLTPDNFDMSLKTIIQLLRLLNKTKKNPDAAAESPVKIVPHIPKKVRPFYANEGTVSQTFPAPSVEGSTPGRAGIDYPAYDSIPHTSFNCATQRYKGFFGDPDTNCQVWHYCDLNGGQASFLCPNGTIFSQVGLTCDWWFNVKCASTAQLYVLNERLYKYILPIKPSFPEDYSGPDVDRYLTEKFREMQSKARGRQQKTETEPKSSQESANPTTIPETNDESVESNQTDDLKGETATEHI